MLYYVCISASSGMQFSFGVTHMLHIFLAMIAMCIYAYLLIYTVYLVVLGRVLSPANAPVTVVELLHSIAHNLEPRVVPLVLSGII